MEPGDRLHEGVPWVRPLLCGAHHPEIPPGPEFLPGKAEIKVHPDRLDQPIRWRRPRASSSARCLTYSTTRCRLTILTRCFV